MADTPATAAGRPARATDDDGVFDAPARELFAARRGDEVQGPADGDAAATPGYGGDKAKGKRDRAARGRALADLQELLFAQSVRAAGTRIVKVMLRISPEEQAERLLARLDDPTKHWKFSESDLDDRAYWDQYMDAYRIAIERTDTEDAPWFIVPADRKWFARLAVQQLIIETLQGMGLDWPKADFDVAAARRRLLAG